VLLIRENSKPKMNPKAVGMNAIGEKMAPACFCDQGQKGETEGKEQCRNVPECSSFNFLSIKLRLRGTDAAFLIEVI